MTPASFAAVGRRLYGERYRCALAAAMGVSMRSVQRWEAGTHPVPAGVADDLATLVAAHEAATAAAQRILGPHYIARVVAKTPPSTTT